ncbi:MAG TPA: hypothetical protein VK743_15170 [Steroidobacteraceae bacterium]|jgi:hypothetical protein|nr:hypothetical protein [Steroidobacteraceae bacterium]
MADPGKKFQYWVGIAAGLTVPIGALVATYLTVTFESRESIRSLVNQREQAETQLKAQMFATLVTPILSPQNGNVSPQQYSTLVRLLALNFNDDFEFGPLMQSADEQLQSASSDPKLELAREELRSVAHRVIDRQTARLWADPQQKCPDGTSGGPSEVTIWVLSKPLSGDHLAAMDLAGPYKPTDTKISYAIGAPSPLQPPGLVSPDCEDSLDVSFKNPNWSNHTIDIEVARPSSFARGSIPPGGDTESYAFQLTPFAFPFSDNTPLADGNRFALIQNDVTSVSMGHETLHIMRVRLRWFPKYYYPPTERPANPKQVQEKLGIGPLGRHSN